MLKKELALDFNYGLGIKRSSYILVCCHVNRLAMHEESSSRRKVDEDVQDGALPAYLLDRENTTRAKACLLAIVCFSLPFIGSKLLS